MAICHLQNQDGIYVPKSVCPLNKIVDPIHADYHHPDPIKYLSKYVHMGAIRFLLILVLIRERKRKRKPLLLILLNDFEIVTLGSHLN